MDVDRILAETFVAKVEHHPEIGSTNDRAIERAALPGLPLPTLVIADRQTAGRGRGANRWWSAEGALTFSLVLEPPADWIPPERWPQISLATAVAVCGMLENIAPAARCGVKWPNDVHCDGKKICGILAEVPAPASGSKRRMVLGVGLNVNNSWSDAPEELRSVGVSISDLTGSEHDRDAVLVALLGELDQRLRQLAARDPRLADAWQSLNLLRERRVTIEAGGQQTTGRCREIDADGALVLETPCGPKRQFGGTVARVE